MTTQTLIIAEKPSVAQTIAAALGVKNKKKEVLDAYHSAVKQADPPKEQKAEPKKSKSAAKKKSSDLEL